MYVMLRMAFELSSSDELAWPTRHRCFRSPVELELVQTQRWFRCLEANYLKTKCRLLEKFLAQLLFEVHTPSLLMTFVGAQQPGLRRR